MPLQYTLLAIVAIANLAWAIYIFVINPRNFINIFFGLAAFANGLWAGVYAVVNPLATDPRHALFLFSLTNMLGIIIALSFFLFTYFFPYMRKPLTGGTVWHVILSLFSIGFLNFSGLLNISVEKIDGAWVSTYHPQVYIVYIAYILFYFGYGFYNLLSTKIKGEEYYPQRVLPVIYGTMVAVVFGVIFSLILPYLTPWKYEWVAPYFSVFMIVYMSYFIFIKKRR